MPTSNLNPRVTFGSVSAKSIITISCFETTSESMLRSVFKYPFTFWVANKSGHSSHCIFRNSLGFAQVTFLLVWFLNPFVISSREEQLEEWGVGEIVGKSCDPHTQTAARMSDLRLPSCVNHLKYPNSVLLTHSPNLSVTFHIEKMETDRRFPQNS